MGKSSPSAPTPPDPVATANAQAQANKEAAYTTAQLNRINQVTPYGATKYRNIGEAPTQLTSSYQVGNNNFGTMEEALAYANQQPLPSITENRFQAGGDTTYNVDGRSYNTMAEAQNYLNTLNPQSRVKQVGGGWQVGGQTYGSKEDADKAARDLEQWEQYVELSPESQQIFDTQQRLGIGLSGLAEGRMGQIPTDQFTLDGLPQVQGDDAARQRIERALYERQSALYEPQFEKQKEQLKDTLARQGIPVGSSAWQDAMDRLDREQNFQRQQTVGQSVAMGEQAFSNQYGRSEADYNRALSSRLLERNQPMNELSAMLQGSPAMQMPQLQQTAQVGVQAPDVMGATYNSYQGQLNQYNQQMAQRQSQIGGLTSLAGTIGTGLMAFNPFGWGAGAAGQPLRFS
jgi:hypothetical protein